MSQMDPLPPPMPSSHDRWQRRSGTFWGGGILILIGVYFLLVNLGLLNWLDWNIAWPVILIALGVWLVVRRLR
jgi:phage shock protein C